MNLGLAYLTETSKMTHLSYGLLPIRLLASYLKREIKKIAYSALTKRTFQVSNNIFII